MNCSFCASAGTAIAAAPKMAHNGAASAIPRRFPSLAFMGLSSIDMPDRPEPGRPLLGSTPGLGPSVLANCRGLNMGMAIAAASLCRRFSRRHDAPRGGPVAFGHRIDAPEPTRESAPGRSRSHRKNLEMTRDPVLTIRYLMRCPSLSLLVRCRDSDKCMTNLKGWSYAPDQFPRGVPHGGPMAARSARTTAATL